MALDKVLKIYDEQGNSVDYDILASDVKFLPDGKDLPTKLTEMEDAIEDAAESGGYTPPQGGIPKTDLAPSVQTSLGLADTALQEADKIQLQAAINAVQTALNNLMNGQNVTDAIDTFNEIVDFLDGINTDDPKLSNQLLALNNAITALQTALAGKISGIKTSDNTPLTPDSNGIVTLPPAASPISPATASPSMDGTANVGSSDKYAREDHVHPHDTTKLSKSDVSVETQGDGTVDIHVGETDYTINLNHTHEGMAKLVKCTEATLPQTLADDTIYVQVDNLTTPSEIEALHIFGLEFTGGGMPAGTPQITSPKSTIPFNLGTAYGQGGATGTVQVKGKNLTANSSLTVSVGSGFSLSYGQQSGSSITIDAADATIGADVDVFATAYGTSGTLLITSQTDNINHSVELTSNVSEDLLAVKLTGTQWMQTDFVPTPNTDVEMKMKLTANSRSWDSNEKNYYLLTCYTLQSSKKQFAIYAIQNGNDAQFACIVTASTPFALQVDRATIVTDKSTLSYSHSGVLSFKPGENGTPITSQGNAVSQQTDPLTIGFYHSSSGTDSILNKFDLTIYELKITDNGSVVRDFKPMRKNGVPGLLDTAANGTGAFISSKTSTPVEEVTSNS